MRIILWSHVCPKTYSEPTQIHGQISPLFGTNIHFTEMYKITDIDLPLFSFSPKEACMYALLPLSPFVQTVNNFKPTITFVC